MTEKRRFYSLLFIYYSTVLIELIFRNVNQISYNTTFHLLLSNIIWLAHNSILLQIYLFSHIFFSLMANNHREMSVIKFKLFDSMPIVIDIVNLLSVYTQYSSNHIKFGFVFCVIRLLTKTDLFTRKCSSSLVATFDFMLLTLIQVISIRYTQTNLFDFIRRLILCLIVNQYCDLSQIDFSNSTEQKKKHQRTTIRIISIILFCFIFDWKHLSLFSQAIGVVILISIYYDTKICLNRLKLRILDNEIVKNWRTCSICYNEKLWYSFEMVIIFSCKHEIRCVCDECLLQHVRIAIQQTFRDDIFCPEENCGTKFDYQSVKNILSLADDKQLLDRYDQYVLHRELEQMDEFIWCSNPSCGVGQLNEGGQSNPIVICYRCHQKTCFIHRIQWHEGMTCEEYDEQVDPGDEPSRQWIATHTKQCPKCPWQIEKNEGCDHMKCIKCKHEFCWSCLADFQPIRNEGNHRHREICKHYAAYNEREEQ